MTNRNDISTQYSLGSNASTAHARARQPRSNHLFAPSLLRRGVGRVNPTHEDNHVLVENVNDGPDEVTHSRRPRRGITQNATPELKQGRGSPKIEFVKRQHDGNYLLDIAGEDMTNVFAEIDQCDPAEEEIASMYRAAGNLLISVDAATDHDAHLTEIARQYFISGAASGARSAKKQAEGIEKFSFCPKLSMLSQCKEIDALYPSMMANLREHAMQKVETEQWLYEDLDHNVLVLR